jgi:hypothetical protein
MMTFAMWGPLSQVTPRQAKGGVLGVHARPGSRGAAAVRLQDPASGRGRSGRCRARRRTAGRRSWLGFDQLALVGAPAGTGVADLADRDEVMPFSRTGVRMAWPAVVISRSRRRTSASSSRAIRLRSRSTTVIGWVRRSRAAPRVAERPRLAPPGCSSASSTCSRLKVRVRSATRSSRRSLSNTRAAVRAGGCGVEGGRGQSALAGVDADGGHGVAIRRGGKRRSPDGQPDFRRAQASV